VTTLESILAEFPVPPEIPATESSGRVPALRPAPKVVLFDVYGTLVAPRLGDLEQQMKGERERRSFVLTARRFGFSDQAGSGWAATFYEQVERELARCAETGIQRGEVLVESIWRSLLLEAGADCRQLPPRVPALYREMLANPVALFSGVKEALLSLKACGKTPGLASNAQFYTLPVLERLLGAPPSSFFHEDWTFLSYRLGFAKPDPHFFRLVRARALGAGYEAGEVLVVGNDPVNDVRAAALHGLQAILFHPAAPECGGSLPEASSSSFVGGFRELVQALCGPRSP